MCLGLEDLGEQKTKESSCPNYGPSAPDTPIGRPLILSSTLLSRDKGTGGYLACEPGLLLTTACVGLEQSWLGGKRCGQSCWYY